MTDIVAVTAVPLPLQPDVDRRHIELPHGLTVGEMVYCALPEANEAVLDRVQVVLITDRGSQIVPRAIWHLARPHAGVHVLIRVAPGKDSLKSLLQILVSVAAVAISSFFFPLAGLFPLTIGEQIAKGALTLGLTALGGLLINALFPAPKPDKEEKPVFAIGGWKNQFSPDGPVPMIFGRHRYAPPFAASSYIEVVGDVLYNRAVFLWGYGPLQVTDLKLGETPVDKFDEIEHEFRPGAAADEPLTLYNQTVFEDQIGTDLERPLPRDDLGEVIDGEPSEPKPVSRFSARDVSHVVNILAFPAGLIRIDNKGRKNSHSVTFKRRYRIVGVSGWTDLPDLTITAKKQAGFYRADRIDFAARGRYEIEYERLTESEIEDEDNQYVLTCTWVVMQSWRPEYPFNFAKPVALSALRVKATAQLNGTLDNFNGVAQRLAPDWNGSDWIEQETKSAAAAGLLALRGPALYRPITDDKIDWPAFEEWAEFCTAKGLSYNRVHDFDASFGETIAAIGAAGRAAIRDDGRKWTVTIDRPQELVVDHINPRNSSDFRFTPSYFEPPHALRVSFPDETNDYQPGERLVPWPADFEIATRALLFADLDHGDGTRAKVTDDPTPANNRYWIKNGDAGAGSWGAMSFDITEELKLLGKTHPDEIYIEATRRMFEIIHRSVTYSAVQQGAARTATSGDKVMASYDVLRRATASARVKTVRGDLVELDEPVTMEDGGSYAIRFRRLDADDTIGESIVRTVETVAGETTQLRLAGSGTNPAGARTISGKHVDGDIIHFGPAGRDSISLIVAEIGRGKNNSTMLTMLPSAEIIDSLADALTPPAWDGRVGDEIDTSGVAPAVPKVVGVDSGLVETGDADLLIVRLAPGSGSVPVATYEVQHRATGAGSFSGPESAPAAQAAVEIEDYESGDSVDFQARALARDGTPSAWGPILTIVIGETDAEMPSDLQLVSATGKLGHAELAFTVGENTEEVRIYHQAGVGGTLDPEADLLRVLTAGVVPGAAMTNTHGDPTVATMIANGDMASSVSWSVGTNWSIGGGEAIKAAPSIGILSQSIGLVAGVTYALSADFDWTAGSFQADFTGGTTVNGPIWSSGSGARFAEITAVSGNNALRFVGYTGSDGVLDNVSLYAKSDTSLQGLHSYWLQPFNDGVPGPISGPHVATIR